MTNNNSNYALEIAKSIVFDYVTKNNKRRIGSIYTFYMSSVSALHENNKITDKEYNDLADIILILTDKFKPAP